MKIGRDKGFAKSANLSDSSFDYKESFFLKVNRELNSNKYLYYGLLAVALTVLITLFSVA